jgi:hypothetical protein
MPEHDVSHGDILYKLGGVEGKIDTLARLVSERQVDLSEAFRRLSVVEQRPDPAPIAKELQDVKIKVAMGSAIVGLLAFLSPLIWQSVSPRLHFGQPPAEVSSHDQRTGAAP